MSFIKELIEFVLVRKKYWLFPLLAVMLLLGVLLVFVKGSAIAPFIYTVF